jgi:hypothetical protein
MWHTAKMNQNTRTVWYMPDHFYADIPCAVRVIFLNTLFRCTKRAITNAECTLVAQLYQLCTYTRILCLHLPPPTCIFPALWDALNIFVQIFVHTMAIRSTPNSVEHFQAWLGLVNQFEQNNISRYNLLQRTYLPKNWVWRTTSQTMNFSNENLSNKWLVPVVLV